MAKEIDERANKEGANLGNLTIYPQWYIFDQIE